MKLADLVDYDIHPDGERFAVLQSGGSSAATSQIHVVLNWFGELKAKMAEAGQWAVTVPQARRIAAAALLLQWLTPMSHTHGRTGVPLLALLIASCQISTTSPPPPMVRLGGAGEARSLRFEDETRPVLDLTSGEARVFRVDVEPGSQMVFAVAILENAPAAGFVHLRLTVEGREVFTDRFSVRRRGHWFHRAITLEDSGPVEIGFRAHHGKARGGAFPDTGTDGEPFIAISMPRVYRAAADERERRVFVWISQDALRADHLGSYGYSRATSPHFDARAESWTVFESATASASWTLPSMTSQFLSRHPSSHGAVLHNLLPGGGNGLGVPGFG